MMHHDPRTVRQHVLTGDLLCFNTRQHPITTLTGPEAALLRHETGQAMGTRLRDRLPLRLVADLLNAIGNRLRAPRCEPLP